MSLRRNLVAQVEHFYTRLGIDPPPGSRGTTIERVRRSLQTRLETAYANPADEKGLVIATAELVMFNSIYPAKER